MNKISDIFEPSIDYVFEEASGEVDGISILGKIRGEFFVPEGESRNGRYYTKELWEKVINNDNVKKSISERRMFGTISHEQELDDKALLEGKLSHIVTGMYIVPNGDKYKGIGEALILNTPAGRILNTVLRARCKIYTSSRAQGKYEGYKEIDGRKIPKIHEDSFNFQTFDFVLEPGFLQAHPNIVESLDKEIKYIFNNTKKGENMLDNHNPLENIVSVLTEEKVKLMEQVEQNVDQITTLNAQILELQNKVSALEDENNNLKKEIESLKGFKEYGSPEELDAAVQAAENLIKKYKEIGTPEQISEGITKGIDIISEYKKIGSVSYIKNTIKTLKEELSKYRDLGTTEELNKLIFKTNRFLGEITEKFLVTKSNKISEEFGIPVDTVKKLMKSLPEKEVRSIVKDMSESFKITEKFKVKRDDDKVVKSGEGTDIHEKIFGKTRAEKIAEEFSR